MYKTDARRLSHKELTELRKRAVSQVHDGESPEVVARVLGVSRQAMYGWLSRYRRGGWQALDANKRGGRRPKLDAKAMMWIYKTVADKSPLQMKFPFALWTTALIRELVFRRFGIRLSKSSICRLLSQLGLSPQKPLWKAWQQNPSAVSEWVEKEYPRIEAEARRARAVIYFGDEAGIRSDHSSGVTWSIKGRTPVIKKTGARFVLNNKGGMRFMLVKGRFNGGVFMEFMRRIIRDEKRKVFLIIDGHPSHRGGRVDRFIKENASRISIFYLPSYSPELNPDEYVWNHVKNHGVGRLAIFSPLQLKKSVLSHMKRLQRKKNIIKSFFRNEKTKYAA